MWFYIDYYFSNIKLTNIFINALLNFFPTIFFYYRKPGLLPVKSPLPKDLFDIIIGLTLGDLHIYRHKTENASLHVEQSIKNEKYLFHLFELLKIYCKAEKPSIRKKVHNITGNTYVSL
jgi:hypothetical protein